LLNNNCKQELQTYGDTVQAPRRISCQLEACQNMIILIHATGWLAHKPIHGQSISFFPTSSRCNALLSCLSVH